VIKKAFTIIELIFIIILIGIMSAVATSYFRDDKLALATYQVLEHIRYTQHLAISEHKFDPKDAEYEKISGITTNSGYRNLSWWQIRFGQANDGRVFYSIYTDRDRRGNIDLIHHIEPAIDPLTQKYIMYDPNLAGTGGERQNEDMLLSSKYDIVSISINGECAPFSTYPTKAELYFDEKGRVYRGAIPMPITALYRYVVTSNCDLTLTHRDGRAAVIRVYPETGYAEITRLD
jgi:type II secretory pathway pseudopilin PulG